MKKKEIYRIINEEINDFDFLGMNAIREEELSISMLNSKEFQTALTNDIITSIANKDKFKRVASVYKRNDADDMTEEGESLNIEYEIEITYNYNGQDIDLIILLYGENVSYSADVSSFGGSRYQPPEDTFDFKSIDWNDVDFDVVTTDGDGLDFDWLKNKPQLHARVIFNLIGDEFRLH